MEMGTNSMGIVPTYDLADRERGYGYGYDGYDIRSSLGTD